MQEQNNVNDPFNWGYVFAGLITALAFPLMHVILGWLVFIH